MAEWVRASTGDQTVDGPSPTSVETFLFGTLAIPFTPLCQCLSDEAPDIIIGTESKLDNTYKNCEIFPQGYQNNVIRRDRNSHGGGVFIIAKDDINITEIEVTNTDCPLVLAKIMLKDEADIIFRGFLPPT